MTSTAVVVVLLLGIASGSHFRGAHFWWAPLTGDGDEVQVRTQCDQVQVRVYSSYCMYSLFTESYTRVEYVLKGLSV